MAQMLSSEPLDSWRVDFANMPNIFKVTILEGYLELEAVLWRGDSPTSGVSFPCSRTNPGRLKMHLPRFRLR